MSIKATSGLKWIHEDEKFQHRAKILIRVIYFSQLIKTSTLKFAVAHKVKHAFRTYENSGKASLNAIQLINL